MAIPDLAPAAERSPSSTKTRHAALPLTLLAVSVVTFAFGLNRWLSLIAIIVAGVAALLTGASAQALLQQTAPPQNLTQVMALWAVAWAGTKPIASLADGWLASTFNVQIAAITLALPAILIAVLELCMTDRRRNELKVRARGWAARQPVPSPARTSWLPARRVRPVPAHASSDLAPALDLN